LFEVVPTGLYGAYLHDKQLVPEVKIQDGFRFNVRRKLKLGTGLCKKSIDLISIEELFI